MNHSLTHSARTRIWHAQEEVDRAISTFVVSEDRGALQGFAVGWHVAGEMQVRSQNPQDLIWIRLMETTCQR